jgi:hypothetical protein
MNGSARTPEELETLFEDSLLVRDPLALVELFDPGSVLVTGEQRTARGGAEIAQLALATWHGRAAYVADPRRVVQARDVALIVADRAINVARRGNDGCWRYAIVLVDLEFGTKGAFHDRRRETSSDIVARGRLQRRRGGPLVVR